MNLQTPNERLTNGKKIDLLYNMPVGNAISCT